MSLGWPDVVRAWEELGEPDGWRVAQVASDGILILPVSNLPHVRIASLVMRQFARDVRGDRFYAGPRLPASSVRDGIFVPDLCVADRAGVRAEASAVPMRVFLVAVEITVPESAVNDRGRKWRAYARGGIPQYLLIDPYDPGGPAATLFTDPVDEGYRAAIRVPFGGEVTLQDPVPVTIDTGEFPRPEPE